MLKILFWNLNQFAKPGTALNPENEEKRTQNLIKAVLNCIETHQIDILIFAESRIPWHTVLSTSTTQNFNWVNSVTEDEPDINARLQFFAKNTSVSVKVIQKDIRYSFFTFNLQSKIILCAVHLCDKHFNDEDSLRYFAEQLKLDTIEIQMKQACEDCILIGDFNLNPFDLGMSKFTGMNALMFVPESSIKIQGKNYPFFYNPMWNLLGDRTKCRPGTYFHNTPRKGFYGWNMLDQVILSPNMIKTFHNVEILSEISAEPLYNEQGKPDKVNYSDHFPLLVELNDFRR